MFNAICVPFPKCVVFEKLRVAALETCHGEDFLLFLFHILRQLLTIRFLAHSFNVY